MKLSFILPTYNEKDNILILIKSIIKSIEGLPHKYEIIIVDDNSPDKTGILTKKYFAKQKNIKTYIKIKDKGLASSIYHGIKKATGDIIFVMDTDFSHDQRIIPQMISGIKKSDLVIGSRFAKGGGGDDKSRYLMSKIYNIFLRIIFGINVTDFLFGYFCVKKNYMLKNNLLNKEIFSGFGDYFMKLIYYTHKSGGVFMEVPAIYKSRIHGESKSNVGKMIFTYSATALKLLFNDFIGIFKRKNNI